MGLNLRWFEALGTGAAAPYELAKHPLGRLSVYANEQYSMWLRTKAGDRGLPSPGKGTLILESDLRGGIAEFDGARPFTPVVLIDGEPVATGFGSGDIDLEPGRYLLQVQTGASGAYWPVDIEVGQFSRMTSFVPQRLDGAPSIESMRQCVMVPTRSVPPRLGHMFTMWLTLLGILGAFAATAITLPLFEGGNLPAWMRLLLVVASFAAGAVGGVACYRLGRWTERTWNRIAERRLSQRLPVGRHRETPCPGGTWRPVDPRDDTPAAGLRLNLAYVQTPHRREKLQGAVIEAEGVAAASRRFRQFGEGYPPEVRPWVEAPRVSIDGETVPAIWGVNEYQIAPGTHQVEIAVPPPPEALLGDETEVELGSASSMSIEVSGTGAVEALARIEMTPSWDGRELQRYLATLERG